MDTRIQTLDFSTLPDGALFRSPRTLDNLPDDGAGYLFRKLDATSALCLADDCPSHARNVKVFFTGECRVRFAEHWQETR